ncbi:DUF6600 domain-containing protein [Variovorax sp. V116]|uniref:DUF6600 domain-containing protein n=1 Tax=Variovorax sp. V116 TaxID=3065953 RepID=UPI0034E87169
MNRPAFLDLHRPWHRWLLGLVLLCLGAAASAQQDPPGRVARLNLQQGTVSFAPAGEDSWYDAQPNRPLTTGDRLWTDRNARAEVHIGSAALRMDGQTHIEFSELDDDTVRLTANQGNLQLRVRDELAGQRVEVDTGNLAVVIDAPGEYRVAADPAAGTTWIAVASGHVTLHGENGESQALGARQQLTVSGRNLAAVGGAPAQSGSFDAWVAERNRIEDQSISARYVSREVVGYQQLDAYGDWQSDPNYGDVWFPRNVDADWAPYRDGQWVNIAPWGLTWVDAAPWGFAPFHYGRWARLGPRWAWVPGRPAARPVYSPALVGFVGGSGANAALQIGNGRSGVGWFPLAPGEAWRPGYDASQRYLDQVNRMAAYRNRQAELRNGFYANQQMAGAVTVLPADRFGRGPFGRRDLVRLPDDRFARVPVAPAPGVPMQGFGGGFGRPAAALPPTQLMAREQQELRYEQARRTRQMQQAQQVQAMQQQQQQQQMEWQRQQGLRQQQDWQQRGAHDQWQQQRQQQQQQQQLQVQQQQQQALRQQQEAQQRAQAQALQQQQQMQQMQQQQRAAQQQALAQQQMLRQQQEMQQRAVQAQQQAQQNAMRQAQEAQVRALQQQRGFAPAPPSPQQQPQLQPGQRGGDDRRRLMTSPDQR